MAQQYGCWLTALALLDLKHGRIDTFLDRLEIRRALVTSLSGNALLFEFHAAVPMDLSVVSLGWEYLQSEHTSKETLLRLRKIVGAPDYCRRATEAFRCDRVAMLTTLSLLHRRGPVAPNGGRRSANAPQERAGAHFKSPASKLGPRDCRMIHGETSREPKTA